MGLVLKSLTHGHRELVEIMAKEQLEGAFRWPFGGLLKAVCHAFSGVSGLLKGDLRASREAARRALACRTCWPLELNGSECFPCS